MKTAVVYKSILGTTKKYANWLAEDTKVDVFTFSKAKDKILKKYDQFIVASGTYAAKMPLTGFLIKKWPILKDKKVIVLSVGISPPEEEYTKITINKIPENIRKSVKIFRLPGAMLGKTPPETGEVKKSNLKKIITLINKVRP
jgi:menaquinone-dependent protoporphyrinogen IX oxidase